MQDPTVDPLGLPPRIAEFRHSFRDQSVGPFYNGWLHLAFVVIGSLTIIVTSLFGIRQPIEIVDWMAIPSTLLIANIVEYLGHRGPMHHRQTGLSLLFHRHTKEHHQFFTEEWMTCRSPRDYKIVLFPPIMLFTYLGMIAFPAGAICYFSVTANSACFAIATAMFYFLSYEVLHFSYHLDENTWIGRLWMVRVLREHHRVHHNQQLMARYNFNITWPVADFLFGTVYHGPKSAPTGSNPHPEVTSPQKAPKAASRVPDVASAKTGVGQR